MLRGCVTGAGLQAAHITAKTSLLRVRYIAWLAISSGASPQRNVLRCALANEYSTKYKKTLLLKQGNIVYQQ